MSTETLKSRLLSGEIVEFEKGSKVLELGYVKKKNKFMILKNGICIKDATLFSTIDKNMKSKYKEYKEVVLCV